MSDKTRSTNRGAQWRAPHCGRRKKPNDLLQEAAADQNAAFRTDGARRFPIYRGRRMWYDDSNNKGGIVMSKLDRFFRDMAFLCMGIIIGFLCAPVRKGINRGGREIEGL